MSSRNFIREKGKFAKVKVLEKKKKAKDAQSKKSKQKRQEIIDKKIDISSPDEATDIPKCGRVMIIDVDVLAEQVVCKTCQITLSLKNIVNEVRRELHTVFNVECDKCNQITVVNTGRLYEVNDYSKKYLDTKVYNDLTTNAVLGVLHAGLGLTELNKLLACMDITPLFESTFKKYQQEVGPAVEEAAKESCRKTVREERKLVIENLRLLYKEL